MMEVNLLLEGLVPGIMIMSLLIMMLYGAGLLADHPQVRWFKVYLMWWLKSLRWVRYRLTLGLPYRVVDGGITLCRALLRSL